MLHNHYTIDIYATGRNEASDELSKNLFANLRQYEK